MSGEIIRLESREQHDPGHGLLMRLAFDSEPEVRYYSAPYRIEIDPDKTMRSYWPLQDFFILKIERISYMLVFDVQPPKYLRKFYRKIGLNKDWCTMMPNQLMNKKLRLGDELTLEFNHPFITIG